MPKKKRTAKMPKKANTVKAKGRGKKIFAIGAVSVGVCTALLFAGLLLAPESQKRALPEPLESNDLIVPVVVRALVLDIPSIYMSAIDSIKSNEEYLKNTVSMRLTIAELQDIGVKDTLAAKNIYKELLSKYRNELLYHKPISRVRGRMANEPLRCMLVPEVLISLGNMAAREGRYDEARQYYDQVRNRYKKDVFGYENGPRCYYADLAVLNATLLVSGNTEFVESCTEADKLTALAGLVSGLREACATPDSGAISRYIGDGIEVRLKKAPTMNVDVPGIVAMLQDGNMKGAQFLKEVLAIPAPDVVQAGPCFKKNEQGVLTYEVRSSRHVAIIARYSSGGWQLVSFVQR